ncbi:hypothetical protein A2U01_0014098, partial [Trifolium medium]|nr:hypothetical protein [Trifolium medium]
MVSHVESKDIKELGIKQWTITNATISLQEFGDDVCNATQAADQICLVFRMQSFQRKQSAKNEYKSGLSLHWPETEQELTIAWSLDFAAMYAIAIGAFGMWSSTMTHLAIEPISKAISDLQGSIITRLQ